MERTPYYPKYDPKKGNNSYTPPSMKHRQTFKKPIQPHLVPVDINEIVPISVPKHYKLLDVITPMVFSLKGKYSSAYATLEKDMEDIEVSDIDYL